MNLIQSVTKTFSHLKLPIFIALAFLIGFFMRNSHKDTHTYPLHTDTTSEAKVRVWTCSMHPQIRENHPGQCPICGMDLIPVTTESAEESLSPRQLKLSPRAAKLAELQVAPVERRFVTREIRLLGKVEYDESMVRTIAAWFPGRIDRLYVDFTGVSVKKGERLADMYSPEIYIARQELFQSLQTAGQSQQATYTSMDELSRRTVEAAREKLRLLGLNNEQIELFEQHGKPTDEVMISSTLNGTVIHKNAVEGTYVTTGTPLYTIADLSRVWVKLDVYESDLEWIRNGQDVEFSAEAYPGEVFRGKIAFIDPVLDKKTRTVKVRVNVPNPEGKLKPDMFVNSLVKSGVFKDKRASESPLVIPASAPLITGKRAVVYVAVPGKEGTYEGRDVVLGQRAGDYYIVRDGVQEGEQLVVNGNFKIDSSIQIQAGPSMMNPSGGAVSVHENGQVSTAQLVQHTGSHAAQAGSEKTVPLPGKEPETYTVPAQFIAQLDSVYASYFRIHHALSHDSPESAGKESKNLLAALEMVDMTLLKDKAHMAWMDELNIIKKNTEALSKAGTLDEARKAFEPLSASLIRVAHRFGTTGKVTLYRFHCPMAFNSKGADWLQGKSDIENPWFGSSMFTCGSLVETISEGPVKK